MYISGSALSANVTPPNKQSLKIKSEFKSRGHVSNSLIKKLMYFEE